MKDIPVIFSGAMVRALLDGRKTMTRRLAMRPARKGEVVGPGSRIGYVLDGETKVGEVTSHQRPSPWQKVEPGDRLWIRESITQSGALVSYMAGGPSSHHRWPHAWTSASRPSIHMPRWASRLTLIVTATKVERLQDISEADAAAEGWAKHTEVSDDPDVHRDAARDWFSDLWTSLHGVQSWRDNPEVVALSFRVVRGNIDQIAS